MSARVSVRRPARFGRRWTGRWSFGGASVRSQRSPDYRDAPALAISRVPGAVRAPYRMKNGRPRQPPFSSDAARVTARSATGLRPAPLRRVRDRHTSRRSSRIRRRGCRPRTTLLEQLLDHRVQPARTDVLGLLVDRIGNLRETADAVVGESSCTSSVASSAWYCLTRLASVATRIASKSFTDSESSRRGSGSGPAVPESGRSASRGGTRRSR